MLWLAACTPMPDSIPDEPGRFAEASEIDRLLVAANPDNLLALQFFASSLDALADPFCPEVDDSTELVELVGGCTDMYGAQWHGTAELSSADRRELSADGFGVTLPEAAVLQGTEQSQAITWILDGRYAWWSEGSDQLFEAKLSLDYTDERDAVLVWIDVEGAVGVSSGFPTLDSAIGTVGLEHWGTAELSVDQVASGWFSNCPYPSLGTVTLAGANTAAMSLGDPDPTCAACPTTTIEGAEVELCEPWFHVQLPGY